MANRRPFSYPRFQAFGDDETFLNGGTITFYDAGTTNKRNVYQDAALTTTAPNPVTLNSRGEPESSGGTPIDIYIDEQPYKIVLKDSDGNTVHTIDNYVTPESLLSPQDPANASDQGTDQFEGTISRDPSSGEIFVIDFQSANTTTTPTFENTAGSLGAKTITDRDGNALWSGAISGVHSLQYDSGADTYLLLAPIGTDANVNNAPVKRDGSGRAKFADPSAAQDAVTYGVLGAEKISEGSFSGASVDISLTDAYPSHVLIIGDLQPATDATDLRARVSAVGGSNFDSGASDYQKQAFEVDGGSTEQGRATEDHAELADDMSNVSSEITSGIIFISNARNSGARTMFYSQIAQVNSAGSMVIRTHVSERISDQADDTIRLFLGSGNFSQGNYQLYGMR